ncbi:nucleotide sugar dehydrogenase [Emticicia sp. CRIBPO]|nr:nucleotide sugar dehydrogenase [Emticicia sp. CRIBPO]
MIPDTKIAVIGLGYVGLPLAMEFGKKYNVLGFDIDVKRIEELKKGIDRTNESNLNDLQNIVKPDNFSLKNKGLYLSSDQQHLDLYNVFIVTVPTPIDKFKAPDLTLLINASKMLGSILKKGDLVIYESTVYPGCTEDDCVPVLEKTSGLKYNEDFYIGYSPERVNPGDKINTLTKIKKVTSGSTPETADKVDSLYKSIIEAGTHKAPSIKVAEASKAIENAQRNVNISFVNELALICDRLNIDTQDVIDAAATKWNFIKYRPGLVGGHCIGVDPYYLTHKAKTLGYYPNVILSGHMVNEQMGAFVANKVVRLMIQKDHKIKGAKALIMGITFKENCPDVRNTRVIDIYHELIQFGIEVDIFDPWANVEEVKKEYDLDIFTNVSECTKYNAIIVAVAHNEFVDFNYGSIKISEGVIFDAKSFLDRDMVDGRL